MLTTTDIILRLVAATFAGSLIGINRKLHNKGAGIKTNALVCMGSALVMIMGEYLAVKYGNSDVARLGAQVISGIGFLGAGTIMASNRHRVYGLTTAAGIWISACIGLSIGIGFWKASLTALVLVIFILVLFNKFEQYVDSKSQIHTICMECPTIQDVLSAMRVAHNHGAEANVVDIHSVLDTILAVININTKDTSIEDILKCLNDSNHTIIAEEI